MEHIAVAKSRYLRITSRKLRLVVDTIRGKNVNDAFKLLHVNPKKGSFLVRKTLQSAVANAQQEGKNPSMNVDRLYVSEILVDQGPSLKRWMPKSMGRATPMWRRTSHLTVKLGTKS